MKDIFQVVASLPTSSRKRCYIAKVTYFLEACIILFYILGGVGLGIGYAFGVIRKKNVYVYSLSTGLNFFIVPLVFFGKILLC